MSYLDCQVAQIGLAIALSLCAWKRQVWAKRSFSEMPLIWLLLGYATVAPLSNIFRFLNGDVTALQSISESDAAAACRWWCGSLVVAAGVCVAATTRRGAPTRAPDEQLLDTKLAAVYKTAFLVLCGAYLLLQFVLPKFNLLNPSSIDDIGMGGSMVPGIVMGVMASSALGLLRVAPASGLAATLGCAALIGASGSKGLGAVYLLWAYRVRWSDGRKRAWRLFYAASRFLPVAAIMSIPAAVSIRYGDRNVSLLDGLGAALGRFTMQDVGAVIYANEAWREGFQRTYLSDNLLAFIPGMFFPGKPLNPSYEINALYYNGISVISSAAPSLFGALLIATGNWLYWPALAIVVWLLGKSEQYFVRTAAPADDFSWLIVFSFALLLEGVYVAPVLFFAVAYSWRRRIIGLQRRIRERLREPTKSAIARRQIAVSV